MGLKYLGLQIRWDLPKRQVPNESNGKFYHITQTVLTQPIAIWDGHFDPLKDDA